MLKKVGGLVWLRFMVLMLSVGFSSYSLCCVLSGFGESGDPSCIIMQIWARIEVSSGVNEYIFIVK